MGRSAGGALGRCADPLRMGLISYLIRCMIVWEKKKAVRFGTDSGMLEQGSSDLTGPHVQ